MKKFILTSIAAMALMIGVLGSTAGLASAGIGIPQGPSAQIIAV
jgi:hypothetical protein